MPETIQQLIVLAAKQFNVKPETLQPDTDFFEKLGINSFQALSLLSEIERHFKIEIPDYELQGITTFQALANVIESRR